MKNKGAKITNNRGTINVLPKNGGTDHVYR